MDIRPPDIPQVSPEAYDIAWRVCTSLHGMDFLQPHIRRVLKKMLELLITFNYMSYLWLISN